ncbi:MAG: wax ester/triacylglycerol synthase family O-acyltransferase [Actinobacteria bacterium]|nr:MAG: wax ester/triacylglycerol synthase family O-acyltransferase [Actinomycetota bacterium]
MAADRLSPLDATFLHVEDAASHMHVACALVFDGHPPAYEDLLEHVAARLHLVPRYRQRLATVPFEQGRPKWVDDERFDLRFHVRNTALPSPGSEYELQVLCGRVFSQQLRRDRPLWEMWLVEGLEGRRFAILSKTHHALVDGISGLDILSVLFAPDDEAAGTRAAWTPRVAPSGLSLLAEALVERATRPFEIVRGVRALLRGPRQAVSRLAETAVGIGAMTWAGLQPAPPSPYNADVVGPDRRFTWLRASLGEVKAIKNALGGTVNDVVLTVVTGALRRHLLRRGEDVSGLELKAFVPVSVRRENQRGTGTLGNQVAGMIAPLPVHCAEPAECLAEISDALRGLKESGQAVGAQALTELTGFAPPNVIQQASRLVTRQRFVNLVVTNVPGPQFPLSLDGRELTDIFPMVPLGSNLTFGVAIVSYNGTMNFGLVGDFNAMYDLDALPGDFAAALEELAGAAGVELSRRPEPALI